MCEGTVTAKAEQSKRQKYVNHKSSHSFAPITVETLGVIGPESQAFLRYLALRMMVATGKLLARQYLLQHLSVAIQQGNVVTIQGTALENSTVEFSCP